MDEFYTHREALAYHGHRMTNVRDSQDPVSALVSLIQLRPTLNDEGKERLLEMLDKALPAEIRQQLFDLLHQHSKQFVRGHQERLLEELAEEIRELEELKKAFIALIKHVTTIGVGSRIRRVILRKEPQEYVRERLIDAFEHICGSEEFPPALKGFVARVLLGSPHPTELLLRAEAEFERIIGLYKEKIATVKQHLVAETAPHGQ